MLKHLTGPNHKRTAEGSIMATPKPITRIPSSPPRLFGATALNLVRLERLAKRDRNIAAGLATLKRALGIEESSL